MAEETESLLPKINTNNKGGSVWRRTGHYGSSKKQPAISGGGSSSFSYYGSYGGSGSSSSNDKKASSAAATALPKLDVTVASELDSLYRDESEVRDIRGKRHTTTVVVA